MRRCANFDNGIQKEEKANGSEEKVKSDEPESKVH